MPRFSQQISKQRTNAGALITIGSSHADFRYQRHKFKEGTEYGTTQRSLL
jgi:hypothetical protein